MKFANHLDVDFDTLRVIFAEDIKALEGLEESRVVYEEFCGIKYPARLMLMGNQTSPFVKDKYNNLTDNGARAIAGLIGMRNGILKFNVVNNFKKLNRKIAFAKMCLSEATRVGLEMVDLEEMFLIVKHAPNEEMPTKSLTEKQHGLLLSMNFHYKILDEGTHLNTDGLELFGFLINEFLQPF